MVKKTHKQAAGLIRSRIVGHGDVNPEELLANPLNFRTHPGHQMDALRGSMKELGWLKTVLVNKTTGHVIDGHARVKEAMRMGLATIPVTILELTPEEERLALAVLDPITELATRDPQILTELLAQVEVEDAGLQALLDQMAGKDGVEPPASGLKDGVDPDAVPEPPKVPVTQPGDLYILGNHRLLCGDSTNRLHVERLMDGAKADMVFTDPPYGIKVQMNNPGTTNKGTILGDETTEVAVLAHRICSDMGVPMIFWGANHYCGDARLPNASCWITWDKQEGNHIDQADCELAWTNIKGPARLFKHLWMGFRKDSEKGEKRVHPTQKPVALIEEILAFFKAGEVILDLFGGSGSTLIACESTGRHARLMELDPIYCDVIVKRWEDATGRKAERHREGER